MFQQRRNDQLKTVATGPVEHGPAQVFDPPCLRGQDIGNVLWQQPSREHEKHRCKNRHCRGLARVDRRRVQWGQRGYRSAASQRQMMSSSMPMIMLLKPMKRIWPSLICVAFWKAERQAPRAQEGQQTLEDQHQRQRAQQQVTIAQRRASRVSLTRWPMGPSATRPAAGEPLRTWRKSPLVSAVVSASCCGRWRDRPPGCDRTAQTAVPAKGPASAYKANNFASPSATRSARHGGLGDGSLHVGGRHRRGSFHRRPNLASEVRWPPACALTPCGDRPNR